MFELLSRHWWLVLLRGIAGVLFGIAAFAWPTLTLLTLVTLFGIYAFADGIIAIWLSFTKREGQGYWWQMLLVGIVSLAAGVVTFLWPGKTAVFLLLAIAVWAVIHGVFEIAAAIQVRHEMKGEWLLILAGILSIVFGLALIARPAVGALAMVWLIGSYSFAFGLVLIAWSLRLLRIHRLGHYTDAHHA